MPAALLHADRGQPLLEPRRSLGRLGRYGLAKISLAGPQLHRLTQAIITAQLDDDRRDQIRSRVARSLVAADNPDTLGAGYDVTSACCRMGRYEEALSLGREGHRRSGRVLGPDHDRTLHFADVVATCLRYLGRYEKAHDIRQDTLIRARATRGQDSRFVFGVAHNLAVDLRILRRQAEASQLNAEIFRRRRTVLGDDHPHTMLSATDVARDMQLAGQITEALQLSTTTCPMHGGCSVPIIRRRLTPPTTLRDLCS